MISITDHDREYYRQESERWPVLDSLPVSDRALRPLLNQLSERFMGGLHIEAQRRGLGAMLSLAYYETNTLALCENASWLTVLHEVAHLVDYYRTGRETRKGGHTVAHRRIVDVLCRYVMRQGLFAADLDHQFESWCAEEIEWEEWESRGPLPEDELLAMDFGAK